MPEHLSKEQDIPLRPGDRVRVGTPGGGGYGDPFRRDPETVAEDARLGRISAGDARRLYGVALTGEPPRVDAPATAALRGGR